MFFSVSTTYNKDGFRLYDELPRANEDNATERVRSLDSAFAIWYLGIDICCQSTCLFDEFRVGLGYETMSSNTGVYAQQHLNKNTLLIKQ